MVVDQPALVEDTAPPPASYSEHLHRLLEGQPPAAGSLGSGVEAVAESEQFLTDFNDWLEDGHNPAADQGNHSPHLTNLSPYQQKELKHLEKCLADGKMDSRSPMGQKFAAMHAGSSLYNTGLRLGCVCSVVYRGDPRGYFPERFAPLSTFHLELLTAF